MMGKKKIEVKILNFGIYTKWPAGGKEMPEIMKFTTEIPARAGIEFGYILQIRKGKNRKIHYRIEHPPFNDRHGQPAPAFVGEVYIQSNDYRFFLGDTVWLPLEDKIGTWQLICEIDGKIVADKSFELVSDFK